MMSTAAILGFRIALLASWAAMAGGYILSGSLTWERIGAVPQMIANPPDCVDYLDVLLPTDQLSNCQRSPSKILFHISLLLHSSYFSSALPEVGGEVDTLPNSKFTFGEGSTQASPLKFNVEAITDFMVGSVAQQAVAVRFDLVRPYICLPSLSEVTATFESLQRLPQCTATSSQICLAPPLAAADSLCNTVIANLSSSPFRLSTRVTFAECQATTATTADQALVLYQMSPLNNHHSPVAAMIPIFTIPPVADASRSVVVTIPGFDEDGASKASNCVELCNNVDMTWDMSKASTDGYTLSCHSDYTLGVRGQWKLSPNDVSNGGGIQLELQGPILGQSSGSPIYPLRLKVVDKLQIYIFFELALVVCPTISLYTLNAVNISVDPAVQCRDIGNQVPNLAPIFVSLGTRHSPPPRLVECVVGSPCIFDVSAVSYSLPSKVCYWDSQPGIPDSLLCDQRLEVMTGGDFVQIDTQHAALQGCKGARQFSSNSSNCHLFVKHVTSNNTARLTVSVFGNRSKAKYPIESDTGRKLVLCFQARKCSSCCYGLPHCVTVHIFGRKPRVVSPGLSPTCKPISFFSNESFQSYVPNIDVIGNCINLPACWGQLTRHPDASPGRPEANGWPSQYAQSAATTDFLFTAVDDDYGDTVRMAFLEQPEYSSIFLLDPAFVSRSGSTRYLQGPCSSADLYQLNPNCGTASLFVNVTVTYGDANSTAPMQFVQEGSHQSVLFTSDKQVCFIATDSQALRWGRGLNSSEIRCHVIRFRGPPAFVQSSSDPSDTPFLSVDAFGNGNGTKQISVLVGEHSLNVVQQLNLTIRARDPNPENTVTILTLEDPGLPELHIDPLQCVQHLNVPNNRLNNQLFDSVCSEGFRRLQWTAAEEEAGKRIRICFVARDDSTMCSQHLNVLYSPQPPLATASGYYSLPYCIDINVVPSTLHWLPPLAGSELGTPYLAHVGCQSSWLFSFSAGNYTAEIAWSSDTQLLPQLALVPLQQGVTGVSQLTFEPVRGQEGSLVRLCVIGRARGYGRNNGFIRNAAGALLSSRQCLEVKVRKCKYCTNEYETLLLQMKKFSPEVNWLRLFAANAIDDNDELTTPLEDPDILSTQGLKALLNIGSTYQLKEGESIFTVAARFQTTTKSILSLNPDFQNVEMLQAGEEVCVIPCSM